MSEYTPTEADIKRFVRYGAAITSEEWDRFIASVKAKALREAADEAYAAYVDGLAPTLNYRLAQMLRDRAEALNPYRATAIENGANDAR